MHNYATTSDSLAVGTSTIFPTNAGDAGCAVSGAQLIGGSLASTLTLYESPDGTATGKIILSMACAANGSAYVALCSPVICNKRLVAVVAGTAATAVVHFIPGN